MCAAVCVLCRCVCCDLASCATTLWMSVNSFASRRTGIKSVQLSNSTPKTDANLFSCLGAGELDTRSLSLSLSLLCFLCKNFARSGFILEIIYTYMLFLRVPFDARAAGAAIICTDARTHVRQICKIRAENSTEKCKRPSRRVCVRCREGEGENSGARRSRTPGHVFHPFRILNLNCKFSCLRQTDTHTHSSSDLNL